MLAEWAKQQAVIISWPHPHSDWRDNLAAVESSYQTIVATIATYQRVIVLCYDDAHQRHVQQQLAKVIANAVYPIVLPVIATNDTWVRDYGPLRVRAQGATDTNENPPVQLINPQFNAWGGKYAFALDNAVTSKLAALGLLPYPMQESTLVLEGGSIDSNGAGALLTTSACLLSTTRNGAISQQQMEHELKQLLQINQIHWLHSGYLAGDDTDSHVDMLARFVAADHIVYQGCDDPIDEHYQSLQAMAAELATLRNISGNGTETEVIPVAYKLTALPWPKAVYDDDGERLPVSYANFLIINGAVLVPSYDDPADSTAQQILAACFPKHQIHAIPCLPLIKQRGSLHCATMQV